MKISYQREFKYNYLIIDPEELIWQGYENQMLSQNQIEGILRFKLRQKDDGVRFYYEINSKQPIARILESRSIRAEEIRMLVIGILGVLERMELYLLREGSILLEPEYLYVGKLSGLLEGDVACAVLAVNDIGWTEAEIGKFPGSLILVDATYQVPYLIKLPLVFSDGKNNACQDALLRGLS